MRATERFGRPPGIKRDQLRARGNGFQITPPPPALHQRLYQRFQAWVRARCAKGMHWGREYSRSKT